MISPATIINISAEEAKKILSDNGMQVNLKQAKDILDFLTTLANATLKNEELLSIHQGKHR